MQVLIREYNCHEEVELFIAGVSRVFFSSLETYLACRCASVMSVSYVHIRDVFEKAAYAFYHFLIIHYPDDVLYSVR